MISEVIFDIFGMMRARRGDMKIINLYWYLLYETHIGIFGNWWKLIICVIFRAMFSTRAGSTDFPLIWNPFWAHFGWFWGPWDSFWQEKKWSKIWLKIWHSRRRGTMRDDDPRGCPAPRNYIHLARNTRQDPRRHSLRASGHGGGYICINKG